MRKPKGYWMIRENCEKEAFAVAEREQWTEIPHTTFIRKAGLSETVLRKLGGREGLSKVLGLPVKEGGMKKTEANFPKPEKWDGKPSKAFEIEAEARKKGMCYADIQKAKTLAMVGGVQI